MPANFTDLIAHFGYAGVALLMFLENVFPPIPSELVMPLAGFVARQGKLALWGVVAAGTLGACAGQLPLYFLGRWLGTGRLKCWLDKSPWWGVTPEELDRANAWFAQRGSSTVFFCRLVPALRSLISIPAGIAGMPLPQFFLYTSAGTLLWTSALAVAGWSLGEKHAVTERFIQPISIVVVVVIGGFYFSRVFRRLREQRRHSGKA
ncbi:MAG TPA: DedA family protein [Chthoniobacteraceae bacterium]|jgi:membrane protein DedA with SNARE-associated domain|nr:DedA family protein [Chthoniobacteraceae bacterium]